MRPAFSALVDALAQLRAVVSELSNEEYAAAGPAHISGSVGQHVRHCLDHVVALEEALQSRRINYDVRQRGRAMESNRTLALATLDTLCQRLDTVDDRRLSGTVEVTCQLCAERESICLNSTIGRELVFVISHTIHHNATINVLLQQRRVAIPLGFGYAVSTLCAQSA